MLQSVVEIIIQLFVEVIGYWTARVLLPIVSVGMLRVEPPSEDVARPKWQAFRRGADGKILVGAEPASLIGLAMLIALVVAAARIAS